MKKIIITTLALLLICASPLLIYYFSSLTPTEESGELIGEVVYVKPWGDSVCRMYIKPTSDNENYPLLCIEVNAKEIASDDHKGSISTLPELKTGAVIKVQYVQEIIKSDAVFPRIPTATAIEFSNEKTDMNAWTALSVRNGDYSVNNTNLRPEDNGDVVYVCKFTSPRMGYLIYLDNAKYGESNRLSTYWIDEAIVDRDSELFALLENRSTGYHVNITPFDTHLFNEMAAYPALLVSLTKN